MPLLIVAAGILILLVLIIFKMKPLYALLIVSILVGLGEGLSIGDALLSVLRGIWSTLESMAIVLCLGAMLGKMIETSGAAHQITHTLIRWFGEKNIQWAVMLTGLLVGIPLFYNAGFVILIPLVFSIALSANVPLLMVGIPMAASLSVTHGFLPPHPGPTAIASIFHADLGKTLLYGLLLSIPAVVLAGPIFSKTLKNITVIIPEGKKYETKISQTSYPSVLISFMLALLPVVLIGLSAAITPFISSSALIKLFQLLGNPSLAIGLSLMLCIWLFGFQKGTSSGELIKLLYGANKDIFLIILIIAAGGGFKQVLVDSGVGDYIKLATEGMKYSPLFLGWFIAALLRVSLGSATVAGLTAAGIVLPFVSAGVSPELMVLAVGSGSLMFSHVNDTGFWMFKEYFNLSLGQTFRSWSLMETIVSICGLLGVMALQQFI